MRYKISWAALVCVLCMAAPPANLIAGEHQVQEIPESVRKDFKLAPFYEKVVLVEGLPIVGSKHVQETALLEAAWLIEQMIGRRPEVLKAMAANNVRFSVMACNEMTTQIPEHSDLKPSSYWDKRARGLGATPQRPAVSCGEENLLKSPGDPYSKENILIHEFGHAIHQMGLNTVDPEFDRRLAATFEQAMRTGLWKGAYASTNKQEYWAEGVQSWFDTNRENDSEHNHVNTREEIKKYDPRLSALLKEVFGDHDWRYSPPAARTEMAHLRDYKTTKWPTFAWPKGLKQHETELKEAAESKTGKWVNLTQEPLDSLAEIRSQQDGGETVVYVVNKTASDVMYSWVDGNGKANKHGRVPSNGIATISTYAGHVWLVNDGDGKPLALVRAVKQPGRAIVE
ncbi:MAG: hypothetical protein NXI22_14145 [bacterium]|nr:hypothetical protein [bacterium]